MSFRNTIVGGLVGLALSRTGQERLGRFLLRRARGEDNDIAETNGEYALLERVARRADAATVIFDVGANKGEWSARACAVLGERGRLFAFEPVGQTFVHLQQQLVSGSGRPSIQLSQIALGDVDGVVEMNVSGVLAGSNSLYSREGSAVRGESKEKITIRRGDGFCKREGIQRITLLKIDTEGHEMAVLRGFEDMLAAKSIEVVQFEYGGTWIDARAYLKDAFDLLGRHGYRLGRLMPEEVDWRAQYRQDLESFRYSNWIAAAPGAAC